MHHGPASRLSACPASDHPSAVIRFSIPADHIHLVRGFSDCFKHGANFTDPLHPISFYKNDSTLFFENYHVAEPRTSRLLLSRYA